MVNTIATIDGIPVYRVLVDDERDGMVRISLVDDPAVMSDFVAFDRQEQPQRFAVQDEEKRLVFGVVARADFPVFRRDARLGDHYVIFPADSIREMAQKYLTENRADRVDLMHEGDEVPGIHLVQWFIKDSAKGVAPAGFDDIADGSLFAEYHVTDDDIWEAVKAGTFKGFSMEVFYTLAPEQDVEAVEESVADLDGMFERIITALSQKNMDFKKSNLLRKLGRMLASFASVTTDKGVLVWDGDEDLKAGDRVYIEDGDGNRVDAADGDYKTEDGKIIAVADGAVAEIRDPEAEVAPVAEEESAAEFASKATDKGPLYWEGEEDLKAGDAVFVMNEAGEQAPAPDGDYRTEDGKVIVVADGVVSEIKDDEAEVAPAAEDAPSEDMSAKVEELAAQVAALTAENAELKEQVAKLSRVPLKDPAKKTVNDSPAIARTGDRGVDKLSRYLRK